MQFEFMTAVRVIGLILSFSLLYEICRVSPLYQSFSMTPVLALSFALASIGFAFPYPFNPLRYSSPFILFGKFETAEKIIRLQISWFESLRGFPKGWYVSDTTYDALRTRLAYCLHRQNKVQEAEETFRNVDVNQYLNLWQKKPACTDVTLAPEIARYQKVSGNGRTVLQNKSLEGFQCICLATFYIPALYFIIAFSSVSNDDLSSFFKPVTDPFLAGFYVESGSFEAAKSKVADLLASSSDMGASEKETLHRYGAHACLGLGDYKVAVEYLKKCKGSSSSESKVIARELAFTQALMALPGSTNELLSTIKELTHSAVPINVLRSVAQQVEGMCSDCASEMRRIGESAERGEQQRALLQILFLFLLWLVPPFAQEKLLGAPSSLKDN
jgi:hypothetical protein